jgi:methionyl aminopeptidase
VTAPITIKTKDEIELMAQAGKILSDIIRKLEAAAKPGVTTKEIDKLAGELVLSHGVKPAFEGYAGFPGIACLSVNDELVHGLASDRELKQGDLVSIDMGVIYEDFYSDSAITIPVLGDQSYDAWSDINKDAHKLISVTKEALDAGIKQAKPGNHIGDISNTVQSVVEGNNLGVVRDLVGHGIGRELHEEPHIPNFGTPGEGDPIKEGMVFAIEPMVTVGDYKVELAKDGFTYKTKDGSLSAHFEHTVAVTKDGPVVLTK